MSRFKYIYVFSLPLSGRPLVPKNSGSAGVALSLVSTSTPMMDESHMYDTFPWAQIRWSLHYVKIPSHCL